MTIFETLIHFGFSLSLLVNAMLFLPQILSLARRKDATGVSLITFLGFNVIQIFAVLHGFLTKDYILAAGFFLSILTCGTVSLQIIYYRLHADPKKGPGGASN
jgi:MtN3 and saliva related transmembrane protein